MTTFADKDSDEPKPPFAACPSCHADAMVPGRIGVSETGFPAVFQPDEGSRSFWSLALTSPFTPVKLEGAVAACLACGFVEITSGRVDPERLRDTIEMFGSPGLKAAMRALQPHEVAPDVPPEGRGDEASPAEETP
jgi:hypothetical protein